jgi:predicted transcriptional regulator
MEHTAKNSSNTPEILDESSAKRVQNLARQAGISPQELIKAAIENFAPAPVPRTLKARTELGKRLRTIRARIRRSRQPLLDEAALEAELAARRGERNP